MIRVKLNNEKEKQLEKHRKQTSSKDSEKALMVIMNNEGNSSVKIALRLKRNPHTVRKWLKRYQQNGEKGLERLYSLGRPKCLRERTKSYIGEIIDNPPEGFGYQDRLWTVALIVHYLKSQKELNASEDTVERSLRDMGYRYKRPAKSVSAKAPSKEEKIKRIKKMVEEIKELTMQRDCEIFALDESHFSTEPYIVKGWQKKRWSFQDTFSSQKGKTHVLWLLESQEKKILLEKVGAG